MLAIKNLLTIVLALPLLGVFVLSFICSSDRRLLRLVALNFSCVTFLLSLFLWVFFNKSTGIFQFVSTFSWIPFLNLNFVIGVDGISLFFILLTTLLIPSLPEGTL